MTRHSSRSPLHVVARVVMLGVALLALAAMFELTAAPRPTRATPAPKPANLVAWFPGDNTVLDIAGSHDGGSLAGNATYASGKVSRAFSFDGAGDYVSVPDDADWDFGTDDFSIDFWVKVNATSANHAFIAHDEGAGGLEKWILWTDSGRLTLHLNGASGSLNHNIQSSGLFSPTADVWYHLAVTRLDSTFTFYVDGGVNGSATDSTAIPDADTPLTIGWAEGTYFLNGLMDEVEVLDRALSGTEVAAIADAQADGKQRDCLTPPQSASMVGWWAGDGSTGDHIGNRSALMVNSANFAAGKVGQAFNFNGTNQYARVPYTAGLDPAVSFTVDAWVYYNGTSLNSSDFQGIVVKSTGTGNDSYSMFIQSANASIYYVVDGLNSETPLNSVPFNEWFHVAMTHDGSNGTKVYINGVESRSISLSRAAPSTGDLYIGARSGQHPINGLVDEVEVWSTELTATEIRDIYLAGNGGKCKPSHLTISKTYTDSSNGSTVSKVELDCDSATVTPAGPQSISPAVGGEASFVVTSIDDDGDDCDIIETDLPTGYEQVLSGSCVTSGESMRHVSRGQFAACQLVNTPYANVTVHKTFTPSSGTAQATILLNCAAGVVVDDGSGPFTNNGSITVTGSTDAVFHVTNFPTGSPFSGCDVDESGATQGYAYSSDDCPAIVLDEAGQAFSCTVVNTIPVATTGKLEVRKLLFPGSDSGRFNLQVDGVTRKSNAGNGGTTGELTVTAGNHQVRETASVGSLNKYISAIKCRDSNGTGPIIASVIGAGPLTVNVPSGSDIVCMIENFRKPGS